MFRGLNRLATRYKLIHNYLLLKPGLYHHKLTHHAGVFMFQNVAVEHVRVNWV